MITDERIEAVRNRAVAGGFSITYSLLLMDLLYRQFYLKQVWSDYWDIFIVWIVSSLYAGITMYSSGMMSGQVGRQFKIMIPVIIVTIFMISFIRGDITSLAELTEFIAGLVVAIPVLILMFFFYYYLNRRWEKKNELNELE